MTNNFWDQFEEIPQQTTATQEQTQINDNNFWSQFDLAGEDENSSPTDIGKFGETFITAAPKKNLLTDLRDCLNWVNRTRISAYQEGKEQVEIAQLETKDMLGIISENEKTRLNSLSNAAEKDYGIIEPKYIDINETNAIPRAITGIKKGYVEAIKMLPYMWETIKAGGLGTGVGAGIGAIGGAATSLATSKANVLPMTLQGARIGGSWGGRISGSIKLAELEAGLARNELKQINQEIITAGGEALSDAELNTLAISVGAVNAGLEMVSLKQILKTVPGGEEILDALSNKKLRELATNKTVREQLKGVLAQYGKTVATEMSTEMLQETTNIVAGEIARSLSGVDNTPLEKNVARVIETGKATFGATLFLGGAASSAKVATIYTKQGLSKIEAKKKAESMTPEEQQEFIENNLDTLFDTVNDIPDVKEAEARQALKNKYYTQFKNTGTEDTEALANATVFSETIANAAKEWGMSLEEAEKKFAITVANMTEEEAYNQYQKDNQEALKGQVVYNENKVIDDKINALFDEYDNLPEDLEDVEYNKKITEIQLLQDIKDGTLEESDYEVAEGLIVELEQTDPQLSAALKSALQRKPEDAKFQSITSAGANKKETALAKREWETKGTESKYFKKWFGNSKVVDENGKPLIVYHGAAEFFPEFDSSLSNYGEVSRDFNFFTNKKSAYANSAKDYADYWGKRNNQPGWIHEVYLSIKKPLHIKYTNTQEKSYFTPVEYYDNNFEEIKKEYNNGNYDGIIIENTDKNSDDSIIYAVPKSEQIKSTGNQGTFNTENPNIYFQTIDNKNIEDEFGETVENLTELIREDVKTILADNFIEEDEFNFEDIRLYGSYTKGKNKETSDLDVLVQYSGTMSEDSAFNMFAEEKLTITDKNGRTVKIDINPINIEDSGTIDEHIERMESFEKEDAKGVNPYFQSAYHGTPHRFDEFSLKKIGSGEGAQVHGWGLYFAGEKEVSEFYRKNLTDHRFNYDIKEDGKSINGELISYLNNNSGSFLYKATQDIESFKEYITNHINSLENGSSWTNNLISMYQREIDRIKADPRMSISKFIETTPTDDRYRFKEMAKYIRNEAKKENRKANIQDMLKRIKQCQEPFILQKASGLETANKLKEVDWNNIEVKRSAGQLFKVDIPENDVLLDENKYFSEQSEFVQNALKKLYEDNWKNYPSETKLAEIIYTKNTSKKYSNNLAYKEGKSIYEALSEMVGSDKNASELLNQYGIKGITYNGLRDGRCYVIFDDKAVNVLKTYYQIDPRFQNSKGYTYQRFNFDGTVKDNLITLIKNKADKSTLLHEFAHVYLTTLNTVARDNERAKEMLLNVNKWLRYDGNEYTVAQHEKFANGFVAYVKSGKAPTYGLKRAFENFRKWLNELYNVLSDAEDVFLDPETEEVFEQLLGGISHNAHKEAAEQLILKAKRYAELRFDDEGIKTTVNQNQLTEYQRRYRDTAYDIIWYALQNSKEGREVVKDRRQLQMILGNQNTDYSKKNKGIKHQAERIYEILSELDDAFSGNDGFLPEWGEFFSDPGVSYHNAESGADAQLAIEAYEVIVENRYLYNKDMADEYGILTEEEIQKNKFELELLLEEYKKADDKTIPMLAYQQWFDRLHVFIQEDFEKQWERATNEIDRYQALSKFEQAKEDLKIYAATLKGHGDYSSQFAEYSRAILKRLDFMTERDKAKIFDKLKEFNSFRDIERHLDEVMDYAETIAEMSERRHLADDIEREVKQTIHEWQNGIKKTKYTYPANKLFARLRELNRMKMETLQDMYDALLNEEGEITYEADAVNNEDYYETIEKMFITFKINGFYYNSTEFLQDLLSKIQGAKFTAKLARDEIDFERRMQQINLIDECARAVDIHKGKVSKVEQAYRHAFNLNSALEMMFNKEIRNKFTLDYLYAQKDAKVGADRDEVLEKLAKVFGFTGKFKQQQLFSKFIDMTKKEFEIRQRYTPDKVNGTYRVTHTDKETGKTFTDRIINIRKTGLMHKEWEDEPIKLSRMELLYYYIQSKNEISYNMLTHMGDETTPAKGQFDKFEFDELINQLTDQEKLMGDILQIAAEKYYPELNKYHIKKYHVELGKVNAYFPRKSETQDVKMLEMFNQYAQLNTNQAMQKQRTAGAGVRIAPANPLAVLFDHMEKANTLIIMGEQLDLMNSVFKDTDLKKKIEAVWGTETAKEFMLQITSNLFSGQQSSISEAESFIGKIENNVIKSQIFFKPQVGLKQVMSFMNYGVGDEFVPAEDWWKKFAEQTFSPQEWKNNIKYMMNIPYLKDRFSRGGSTDALKRQLEQRMFAKISLFDDIFSANVRYGDMGAIILGGKPYIDCLLDKGYSEEQAIKIFIEKTVNDQQSSIPSTLSNIQRSAAKQPLAKMFFAYQNTPWQYFRTACNSIIRFKQNPNKETALDMGKLVGCYLFLFPFLFNIASSLSPIQALGGDDDAIKEDFWKSIIGGVTFVPIAGMFINTIYSGFRGERANTGNWFDTAASKLGSFTRRFNKGELSIKDVFDAICLFAEAGTGVPATSIKTEATGVADIVTGSPAKGILKLLGYSDYRARVVTGEE